MEAGSEDFFRSEVGGLDQAWHHLPESLAKGLALAEKEPLSYLLLVLATPVLREIMSRFNKIAGGISSHSKLSLCTSAIRTGKLVGKSAIESIEHQYDSEWRKLLKTFGVREGESATNRNEPTLRLPQQQLRDRLEYPFDIGF